MKNFDIFVSYNSEYVNEAKTFAKKLTETFKVSFDVNEENVWLYEKMTDKMDNSKTVLCLLTKKYPIVEKCKRELLYACQHNKPIIVLMIQNLSSAELADPVARLISSLPTVHCYNDPFFYVGEGDVFDTIVKSTHTLIQTYPDEMDKIETVYYKNGERYEGELSDGKKHGSGIFYFLSGSRYVGEWREDKINGKGVMLYSSGDRYEGEFVDGVKNGKGVYYFCNGKFKGDQFIGEYKANKKNGKGCYYHASGNKFEGEYYEGKKNGVGVFFINYGKLKGDKFVGDYKSNRRDGKGIYYHANGNRFEGDYSEGRRHGEATFYMVNGEKYLEVWQNGIRIKNELISNEKQELN